MRTRHRHRLDPNTVVLLKHVAVGIVVFSLFACLMAAIWYGTRLPELTLTEIDAQGGETIQASQIIAEVESVLAGTYLGLVPRRFAWTYPQAEIRSAVAAVERVYNVQVHREGGTTLHVTYDEYVPFALWCRSVQELACVFLTREGFAFASAPQLVGGPLLRMVTTGREPAVGEMVLEQAVYTVVHTLVNRLAAEGWFVSAVEIDQVGDAYLRLPVGGVVSELKVSTAVEPDQTVDDLLTVLASETFSHLRPGNFNYIDLRFGNKVYVRESFEPQSTTASTTELLVEDLADGSATTSGTE